MRVLASVSAVVIGIDLATKAVAVAELGGGKVADLPAGASLRVGENPGAAFGLLAGSSDLVFVAALSALSLIAIVFCTRPSVGPVDRLGAGLLLGGGLANLLDRLGDGSVTDFISVGGWPAFNGADAAVTVGAGLVLYATLRTPEADPPETTGQPALQPVANATLHPRGRR